MLQEIGALRRRHLDTGQHPTIVGAVVAVVEQADVPAGTDRLEKPQQGSRAFRKLEAIQHLVLHAACMPAYHVAHMQLRHFVFGHVGDRIVRLAQRLYDRVALAVSLGQAEADEDLGRLIALVAVVELGDAALAEHFTEVQKAARLLRYDGCQQRLALGADIRALRHVPQAIEIHVGAAIDGDDALVAPALPGHELLDAGNGERSGGLDDRTGIFKYILDGGTDLVGIQQQDLVHVFAAQG